MQKSNHPATDYELNVGKRYEVISRVAGVSGHPPVYLGSNVECRFCGEKNSYKFRSRAHTFPEFLGNKTVFSLDECDLCNKIFAQYDSALAEVMRPYLTLSGIKGKTRKIPQTGRTDGDAILRRHEGGERPRISCSLKANSLQEYISINPLLKKIKLTMPIPLSRAIPRHAYKALSKIGFALLPAAELKKFTRLKQWLQNPKDNEDFHYLEVISSIGEITNPLPMVDGVLLRRTKPLDNSPYMIFIFTAASLCFQIELMSDPEDGRTSLLLPGAEIIQWRTIITGRPEQTPVVMEYSGHHAQNWASPYLEDNFLKKMSFNIDIDSQNFGKER